MPGTSTATLQALILFLLVAVAFFAGLAKRLHIPYPILLVLAGLAISFIPHVPQVTLRPDMVFTIFLPPLLYSAAWETNWRDFRRNLLSISMLAIGLVGFTVFGVAQFAPHFIPELDYRSGFLLGAIVAATDAVAASSIGRSLGLAPRTMAVLNGESLLNDATGLLALEFGLALLLGQKTPTVGEGLLRLVWLIAGGIGSGFLLSTLITFIERWVEDGPIEMVISLIVPYIAYILGEEMRASGVLAVVTCGLVLSRRSARYLSAPVRLESLATWRALDFTLNGVVFLMIGLQLPEVLLDMRNESLQRLAAYAVSFAGLLLALRLVWVYPGAKLSYWIRAHVLHRKVPAPGNRDLFIVGWAGMRGVIALAAAYSIPRTLPNGQPFVQRDLIVFLTFSVILITLVVQGLSLPPLIRLLGLDGNRREIEEEELNARCRLLSTAIRTLDKERENASPQDEHDIEDVVHRYSHRLEALNARRRHLERDEPVPDDDEDLRHAWRAQLIRNAIAAERNELLAMRRDGFVGDDVLRVLERELDLTETRYDSRDFRN